ncbi:MAG: Enolase [Holosporales bacterium]
MCKGAKKMCDIIEIKGREILDSRGNPTLEVDVVLEDGTIGRASVPSGASTGSFEAAELRDGDKERFGGKGVLKAIKNIETEIQPALAFESVFKQRDNDQIMFDLDETPNKSRIGANTMLAVSLAMARAAANQLKIPLFRYLGGAQCGFEAIRPMMNVINGGAHGDNDIDIQEFMIIPQVSTEIKENIRAGSEIFHTLKTVLRSKGFNTNVGDEGGFAPALKSSKQALDMIVKAIEKAGYKPGGNVHIGLDVAATELYKNNKYHLKGEKLTLDSDGMIRYFENLVNDYPIVSIEDPLAEDDWDGWANFTEHLSDDVPFIIGDDLFVTKLSRLHKGMIVGAANSILIKPNQIGTLSETLAVMVFAMGKGYTCVVSHRSGETEDPFISHLAYACNVPFVKMGAPSRTDRVCKYNELIRIEELDK